MFFTFLVTIEFMVNTKISFYQNTIDALNKSKSILNKQISILGWSRLLVFITAAFSVYYCIADFNNLHLILLIGSIIVFLFLLYVYNKLSNERELITNMIIINENEVAVLAHRPSIFDSGNEYLDDENYHADLDIFGDRSLFHLINRTTTIIGKERLATLFKAPLTTSQGIKAQQAAIKELSEKTLLRQHYCAIGMRSSKNQVDYNAIFEWLDSPNEFIGSPKIRFFLIFAPLLIIGSVVYGWMADYYWIINYAIIINLIIAGAYTKRINKIHQSLSKNLKHFADFAEMFDLINQEKFNAQLMVNIRNNASEGQQQFKALSKLGNFFDQRINLLVSFFLNVTILFDIQCVYRLETWKKKNKSKVGFWLNSIAETETLSSLGTFCFNHPEYIFPQVNDQEPFLNAKDLAHPLIPSEDCVSNDITLGNDQRLFIITGSNMSGKSTFLRTIGVNVLLARCGAPVCATAFECSVMDIYTSLRQTDSLLDHVSLFFSELRKLKSILHGLSMNPRSLVLLDEVLRGTNSDDKLYGSQELVKKLIQTGCVTILATHDIALSKMSNDYPETIKNWCFESSLENNQLSFDYKLKSGVSQNRNATFLMKQMGIID
jgi:hypothetical protein